MPVRQFLGRLKAEESKSLQGVLITRFQEQGMKYLKAAFASAMIGCAASAIGGVADTIDVVVTPIAPGNVSPPNATYTDPITQFNGSVGYQVNITNQGKNTSNNVVFRAEAYVNDPYELATFEFKSADGAVCSPTAVPPPGRIQIQCNLGTLRSGQVVPTFYVFFKTPQKVVNGQFDSEGTDLVNLFYEVLYAEQKNGPNSTPSNGFTPLLQALPEFVLGTPDPTLVRSVVLRTGGSFATGNNGVASLSDQFAVKSIVPPLNGAAYTTVQIQESGAACNPASPNVKTCYRADFNIPGTFAHLKHTLSMAIQNVKTIWVCPSYSATPKAKNSMLVPVTFFCRLELAPIGAISFDYVPDGSTSPVPVPDCALKDVPNTPLVGDPYVPCINVDGRKVVKDALNKPIRYEWTFLGVKNGPIYIRR
jgi:hypothetical protein